MGSGPTRLDTVAIGFLRAVEIAEASQDAFLDELAAEGWVEGDNLTILDADPGIAHADPADAEARARELAEEGVDLVIAFASQSALAAREALADEDIPILFLVSDPIAAGLVTDPQAPDGNLTGSSFVVPADRTLDVLTSLGDVDSVAVASPEDDPGAAGGLERFERAGRALDLDIIPAVYTDETDAADAVRAAAEQGADAIALVSSTSTVLSFDAIEAASLEVGLPVIANTQSAEFALIVLSPDSDALYRQLGRQAARLLDGTEVREVPVEDPGGYTLTLRSTIAERLGIRLPDELTARADELVE